MKIIKVKVIPNAKRNEVREEEGKLRVYLTATPVKGNANKALIKILSEFFDVKKNDVRIIKGEKSREKVVEIRN